MKTVFGLFEGYSQAVTAVDNLIDMGFDEDEINVLVEAEAAKTEMDVDLSRVRTASTDEIDRQTVHGLDAILGTQRPVRVPDLGYAYAAGTLATLLASTALAQDVAGLEEALIDLSVPDEVAAVYQSGLRNGGFLIWVRCSDEQAGDVIEMLRREHGVRVGSYAG